MLVLYLVLQRIHSLRAASASTQGPEKLRVAAFGNFLELSIGCDNLKFDDVVNLHAKLMGKWIVTSCLHPATNDTDTLLSINK